MSDATDAAVDEGLVERLTEDAIRCSGAEKCVVPLMYCAFGPADRCDEIAELWLHVIAERDALLAEHEAVGEGYGDETADVGCDCLSCRIIRAHDNAERVIRGE